MDTNSTVDHLMRYHRKVNDTATMVAAAAEAEDDDDPHHNHLLVDLENVDAIINYVIKMQYICSK